MAGVSEAQREQLKACGVWAFFHKRRSELTAEGRRDEAQDIAYEEAMKFARGGEAVPAAAVVVEPVVAGAKDEGGWVSELGPRAMEPEFKFEETVDMRRAANWVIQALALPVVRYEQAPTLAAWSLYQWARKNQDEFFRGYGVKQMPSKVEDAGEAKRDDGRKQIGLAQRLRAELEKQCDPTQAGASGPTVPSA